MEATMERRSNLVMPTIGYELDCEEMSYVEGGIYISYSTIQALSLACGPFGANVIGTGIAMASATFGSLKAAMAVSVTAFFSWFHVLPIIGQILFAYIAANALLVAGSLALAYMQKKGVDLSLGWCWFVPYVKTTIR